ncbi:unnamed protein product [Psylliodes chrysocephalus]|uniref:HAT C-terminal dimerisation domain-containing protein n=1 Tax=Psylliodes chrysocephalus TaxID=3402493 RepID=A0A9P0GFH4_9CUCU|nr:unnamed protein product [Psylliodes chrysocephala]
MLTKNLGDKPFCIPLSVPEFQTDSRPIEAFRIFLNLRGTCRFQSSKRVNAYTCVSEYSFRNERCNALFEEDEVPDEVDAPGEKAASLWRHHDTLIKENRPQVHSNDKAAEITFYLNQPVEDLNKTNPIKFWNSQMFVNLRKITVRYFCITATSVPSERLFSEAGQILTEDRSRLTPERFDRLLFLNCLEREDWCLD